MVQRISVILEQDEYEALLKVTRGAMRSMRDQIRYMLRAELERSGLLPIKTTTPEQNEQQKWVRIEDGGAPIGWVQVAVEWHSGSPPSVVQAYWERWGPKPGWRTWGFGELPPEAVVVAWHPMPELPYDMMHVATVTER